jgi:hypothetical protein
MRVRDIAKHFDTPSNNGPQSRLTNGACFARSSILLEGLLSFIIWPGGGLMISIRCLWETFHSRDLLARFCNISRYRLRYHVGGRSQSRLFEGAVNQSNLNMMDACVALQY